VQIKLEDLEARVRRGGGGVLWALRPRLPATCPAAVPPEAEETRGSGCSCPPLSAMENLPSYQRFTLLLFNIHSPVLDASVCTVSGAGVQHWGCAAIPREPPLLEQQPSRSTKISGSSPTPSSETTHGYKGVAPSHRAK